MGGNALSFKTKRLPRKDFVGLEKNVCAYLSGIYNHVRPLRWYSGKEDFGDLDVLVCRTPFSDPRERIQQVFQPKEIVSNSNVLSFDFQDFQIDVIHTKQKYFDSSYFYFSFNDLNNLVGKMYHKFGLKFGHMGVVYPLRNPTGHHALDIELTRDPKKIYEFIDLDFNKWVCGFNTLEEIFEFVVSSEWFSVDMFQYKNLNHRSRTRDKKRKVFNSFLKWLDKNSIRKHYSFNKDKKHYLDFIDRSFPEANFRKQYDEFWEKQEKLEQIKEKFNGHLLMGWLAIEGKELGNFISSFKSSFNNFNEWALQSSPEHIKTKVVTYYFKEYE